MVLLISMSVHEIQCGSLVHFCMVNLGYKKSGHHSIFDLGGFETGPYQWGQLPANRYTPMWPIASEP